MKNFLKKHQISPEQEQKVVKLIEDSVKINPTGVIDWYKMTDVVCIEKVSENAFEVKIQEMAQKFGANIQNTYFVIQVDNLHPPLKSKLENYFAHIVEVLHYDTIFIPEDRTHIIHYDFYGDLWREIVVEFS